MSRIFILTACLGILLVTLSGVLNDEIKEPDSISPMTHSHQISSGLNSTRPMNKTAASKEYNQHTESCPSAMQEFVSPMHGKPRCCRKCETGTGMLRLCTDTKDTLCWPCEPGLEFAPTMSATAKCLQCRRCQEVHPLAKIRIPCTPTTNTICDCKPGYYMSVKNQTCKPCSVCRSGEAVFRPCDWNSDTQCQACPRGFWFSRTMESVKCIPCQSCSDNQLVARECSGNANTLCCPKSKPNCTSIDASMYNYLSYQHEPQEPFGDRVKHNEMLPIYCSLMGLIIVCLLFYVIYKLWKQHDSATSNKLSDMYCIEANRCDAGSGKLARNHQMTNHVNDVFPRLSHTTSSGASSQNSDSGSRLGRIGHSTGGKEELEHLMSNGQSNSPSRYSNPDLLVNVPIEVLGVLCYQLSVKGWRQLAAAFGLSEQSPQLIAKSETNDQHYASLLRATLKAKSEVTASHEVNRSPNKELFRSIGTIHELCSSTYNISTLTFSLYLRRAERGDLLQLLGEDEQLLEANGLKVTSDANNGAVEANSSTTRTAEAYT